MSTISLKRRLIEPAPLVGLTTQHVTQPWLAKLWKYSGCDFVYVEYEHGFFNEGQLADFVLACRSEGLPVVAKTPELSRTSIAKLLESGVVGIQLPWTETREQVDRLVSYVKFPPIGIRAAAPAYGNCDYRMDVGGREFIQQANDATLVLAHVETGAGVANIDEILGNPHVDIVFVGMYDLSVSLGTPGDFTTEVMQTAVRRVVESARSRKKTVGMWVPDAEAARFWFEQGVTFFETQSEVEMIAAGSVSLVNSFRRIGRT